MIKQLKEQLKIAGKDENEVFVALSYLLNKTINEARLLKELDKKTEKKLTKILNKRIKYNMPLDIIFKSKNFYGREFYVNKNVLTPRQETELLVERVVKYIKAHVYKHEEIKILDLCCGSGCIGLTLAKELDNARITLSDISKKAIKVAKKNAKRFGVTDKIKFNCGHLFENLGKEKFSIIACNPPYITEAEFIELDEEVKRFDPKPALVAQNNGYYFYEKIIKQVKEFLNANGVVFFEVGMMQAGLVSKLLQDEGLTASILQDYNNTDRIVIGRMN